MNDFSPTESMLNNYIQNKLSDNETEKLELWLVNHPDVMEDLEMGEMFKQADFNPNIIPETIKTNKGSWLGKLFPNPALVFSHAAVFAFGMFLFYLLVNDTNTNSVATLIELEKQRGLDTSVIQVQTNKSQSLVLRFFPDSMTERYSLIMKSKSLNQQYEFKDLVADDYGSITVTINSEEFIVGEWGVSVINSQDIIQQEYLINVTR